jgi:acyl carrier protein
MSGTNCHVILQAAPDPVGHSLAVSPVLPFVFSAQSASTLKDYAARLAEASREWLDEDLTAICATAARRRTHLKFRHALAARTVAELRKGLIAVSAGDDPAPLSDASWLSWGRRFERGEPVSFDDFPANLPLPGRVEWPARPWNYRPYWSDSQQESPASGDADVCGIVAAVLGSDADALDPDLSLIQLGLDSLMALELSGRIRETYRVKIPPAQMLGGMLLSELTQVSEGAAGWEEARV